MSNLAMMGMGGAPTRATTFPKDAKGRKQHPVASGVLDYFPDAIVALAQVSWTGNEQHNPGQPLHWARGKSGDEGDALMRHFLERGTIDTDGIRHSAKVAWRALALLQKEIEADKEAKAIADIEAFAKEDRDRVFRKTPDFDALVQEELDRVFRETLEIVSPSSGICACRGDGSECTRDLCTPKEECPKHPTNPVTSCSCPVTRDLNPE